MINIPPQIILLAIDADEYFVEELSIAWPSLPPTQESSIGATEFETTLSGRLVPDIDSTSGPEILSVPEAQAEKVIQPYGVANDLAGIAITGVKILGRIHPQIMPR